MAAEPADRSLAPDHALDCAARVKRLREILGRFGREIPNSVPGFVHTLPFAPLTKVLGPKGERWVPLHRPAFSTR